MSITPLRIVAILCDQDNLHNIEDSTIQQLQADPTLLKQALQVAFAVGKHSALLDVRKDAYDSMSVVSKDLAQLLKDKA